MKRKSPATDTAQCARLPCQAKKLLDLYRQSSVETMGMARTTPKSKATESRKGLYISRPLLNAAEITAWATQQGFPTAIPGNKLHVTLAYSNDPVCWEPNSDIKPEESEIRVPAEDKQLKKSHRALRSLGDEGAVALTFTSPTLTKRWTHLVAAGMPTIFPDYLAHVTITFAAPKSMDLTTLAPYSGQLVFGGEVFQESDKETGQEFMDTLVEDELQDQHTKKGTRVQKEGGGCRDPKKKLSC